MGKQMKRAFPGALNAELTRQGRTQSELAQDLGMDRKTLRAIDRGQPVKDTTLQKIAVELRVPIDHLLKGPSEKNSKNNNAGANSILLRAVKAPEIKALLSKAVILKWKLLLDNLDSGTDTLEFESTDEVILKFEKVVNQWWTNLKTEVLVEESLSEQLGRLVMGSDCETIIEKLKTRSISVLGGEYLHWPIEIIDNGGTYQNVEDDNGCPVSLKVAILALAPSSIHSKRIEVDIGLPPPEPSELPPTPEHYEPSKAE
jgi:transcriptional regulator with XRE-family HTH domain